MKQILVIDDDPQIRSLVKRRLEKDGYSVWEAVHGKEALKILDEKEIDLAIVDIIMPEKGGIETLMEFKNKHPRLKTVVISGKVDTEADSFTMLIKQFGSQTILTKPFELDKLVLTVEKLLDEETGRE